MEVINKIIAFMSGPYGVMIIGVLLLVSESLAAMPQFKSNSIIQLIVNSLKWLKEKLIPSQPAV